MTDKTTMSSEQFCGRITIRLPENRIETYKNLKEYVKTVLHSDVCYVVGDLIESFYNAVAKTGKPPVEMTFPKQNIQINMGCTFHYNVRRAKRMPTHDKLIQVEKNYLLPQLVDLWHELGPEAKRFWRAELVRSGIIPEQPLKIKKPRKVITSHTRLHKIKKRLRKWFRKFQRKQRG